jgi:hypothetical protein
MADIEAVKPAIYESKTEVLDVSEQIERSPYDKKLAHNKREYACGPKNANSRKNNMHTSIVGGLCDSAEYELVQLAVHLSFSIRF